MNKINKIWIAILSIALITGLLSSCKKEKEAEPVVTPPIDSTHYGTIIFRCVVISNTTAQMNNSFWGQHNTMPQAQAGNPPGVGTWWNTTGIGTTVTTFTITEGFYGAGENKYYCHMAGAAFPVIKHAGNLYFIKDSTVFRSDTITTP